MGEAGAQQIVCQGKEHGFSSTHNTQGAQERVNMEATLSFVKV